MRSIPDGEGRPFEQTQSPEIGAILAQTGGRVTNDDRNEARP
jgi:hypothetical protein